MKRTIIISLALWGMICSTRANHADDNIVITEGFETYTFMAGDKGTTVKTRQKHVFEATRRAETLRSSIFYSDRIKLDGASGKGKALYKSASADGVFHDDSKVCYYDVSLDAKGKKASTDFRRTYTDPAFFAKIFISEAYPIRSKTIRIDIPSSLGRIDLVDINFPADGSISRSDRSEPDGSRSVTYTIANLPPLKSEPSRPDPFISEPCILIKGWFPTVDALYEWEREISRADTSIPNIEKLINDITSADASIDRRIADTFRWVQQNIRYIAYEEGEAGHRPDAPAEVIRKRYGDCKGMSLLLATLLRHQNIDARIASTGTCDIPVNISELPSLAAANHMICVAFIPDRPPLFLDATSRYTPYTHIPYSIRGKETLVHDGSRFDILRVPAADANGSYDSLSYRYNIVDGTLKGSATRTYTGDVLESAMRDYHSVKSDRQPEALALMLVPHRRASIDTDGLRIDTGDGCNATVSSLLLNEHAITESDGKLYVDLNTSGDPCTERIDTYMRTTDYMLPFPATIIRTSELNVPKGYTVTYIPENFDTVTPQGRLSCTFTQNADRITMVKSFTITEPRIRLKDIDSHNKALSKWTEACNRNIELTANR